MDTKYENVNFILCIEKNVEVITKDVNFSDTMLMSKDIDNELEEYKDII